jgi:hypothetical protein
MISIHLQSETLQSLLQTAGKLGHGQDAALAGARGAAALVRRHLLALDVSSPNKLHGPRTHFYARAAQAVQEPVPESQGASFTIDHTGLAQRRFGGRIEAGKGTSSATGRTTQYLAIPARPESYGRKPGDFAGLVFIRSRNGGARLVQQLQTTGGSSATSPVMFWLVTAVRQLPDPKVLPGGPELAGAAAGAMDNYLAQLLASDDGSPEPKP